MASFKSILNTILGIEHFAAPVINSFVPGFAVIDGFVQRIQATIQTVEVNNPVTAAGPQKAAAVIADFESGLSLANAGLALEGKILTYDKAALDAAIAAQVTAYNAFAAVKASVHVVALAKPA